MAAVEEAAAKAMAGAVEGSEVEDWDSAGVGEAEVAVAKAGEALATEEGAENLERLIRQSYASNHDDNSSMCTTSAETAGRWDCSCCAAAPIQQLWQGGRYQHSGDSGPLQVTMQYQASLQIGLTNAVRARAQAEYPAPQ